jgi:hypothetical protein
MKNQNTAFYLLLVFFIISFFAFVSSVDAQTNYYTKKSGDWDNKYNWLSSKKPGDEVDKKDTVFVSHDMDMEDELKIKGVVVVKTSGKIEGEDEIKLEDGGKLFNSGTIELDDKLEVKETSMVENHGMLTIDKELKIEGEFYNYNYVSVKKEVEVEDDGMLMNEGNIDIYKEMKIEGYMNNSGAIALKNREKIELKGGTIEGGGNLVTDEIEMDNNNGNTALLHDIHVCGEDNFQTKITVNGGVFDSETVIVCAMALPVEMYRYEVALKNNNVRIDWATQSETNCDYFEVERSRDGYHFEAIGKEFGAGTSESLRYYSITDRFPFEGKSYYRLKQVDFDGTTTYFDVKMVENNDGFTDQYGLSVFPNPIMEHGKFNIGLDGFAGNTVQINIVNMTGVLIYSDEFTINQERELIELSSDIIPGSGTYVVSIFSNKRWYHYKFNYLL